MGRSNVFASFTQSACRRACAGRAHGRAGGAVRDRPRVAFGPRRNSLELPLDDSGHAPGRIGCRQPERLLRRKRSSRVSSQWLSGVLRFGYGGWSLPDTRQPDLPLQCRRQARVRRERVPGILLLTGPLTARPPPHALRGNRRRSAAPRARVSRWGHARRGRGSCRPRRSARRDRPPRRCAAPRS